MNRTRRPKAVSRFKQPYTNMEGATVMLTDQQHKFTEAALQTKDSEALIGRVMEIYQTDKANARVIARENFQKPNIAEYLGDRGYRALDVLNEAMTDKQANWSDRIKAAQDIADRQFGRAIQRTESHSTSVNLNLSLTDVIQ